MKARKRFLSLLLAVCLVIGLLPTTAFAVGTDTGKAIMLGASGIKDPTKITDTNGAYYTPNSYIYFGMNGSDPIKWRVLDADKANNSSTSGMFLLSEHLIGKGPYGDVYFQQSYHKFEGSNTYHKGEEPSDGDHTDCQNAIDWQNSDAQKWCKNFASTSSNFSAAEQSAMLGIAKTDNKENSFYNTLWDESRLMDDKMFFLSVQELADYVGNYSEAPGLAAKFVGGEAYYVWWLRSPYANEFVGVVYNNGKVDTRQIEGPSAARPAFNLNLDSVLFTSAATGGRSSGTRGTLSAVSDYTDKEWKLTLLDSSRSSFKANVNGQMNASTSAGGSVQITYSGAQTGDNEYVSALLCDSNNGTVLYYGNIDQNSASGTAAINIPSGLAAGNYKLKVFSEQCNGDKMTDYASAFQDISLTVTLPQETTPQATFAATGDNGGTLSNVEPGMKYSTDGGTSWTDITGITAEITGVTANKDIQVVKKGDGTATADSDAQIIDVTQAAPPKGIGKTDCTTTAQNDGTITGVDSTMEYQLSTASEWTSISGNTVTGLENGTYAVRVKANSTVLASEAATVTIGKHTCAAQGEWQYDANEHWKLCSCGVAVDKATHSGGEATCTAQAVCEACKQSYGEENMNNHTGDQAWKTTETGHTKVWACCGTVVKAEVEHTWEDGTCTVCGYPCEHTGGEATCSQLAVCELCGSQYGALAPDNHKAVSAWTQENGKHYHKCEYGCDTHLDEADCSGGEATCTALAICEVCGQSYGEKDMNNHTDTVVWVQTATTHKQVYSCCQTEASQEEKHNWADGKCTVCDYSCTHTGGTATCSQLAVCELCGSQYGALAPDNHKAVSAWTQENGKHYHKCEYGCDTHLNEADCSGGEATCTALAVCETCGNSYGAINPDNHTGEIVWTKTATDHSSAYDCCGATVVAKEAHEWENGVCSECGYECQHDGGTATCADKAVCDTCGEEYGKVNASNHTNLVKTEAKAATHMTEGNIEYWYCDGCDKYFSDEAGTKEIALKDTVIPKLTEHTADSTGWHFDEMNHWNTCECGEKLNEAAHTFEWVIDKEATAAEKGSKHEKCTVCGYEKAAVEIPATGTPSDSDTSSPQTGDDSNIALWIAVMLAAGTALTGTVVYSHKRKYSK